MMRLVAIYLVYYPIQALNVTQYMTLQLRPATLEDAQNLFDWRSDEDTRKNSRNIAAPEWEGHVAWLTKVVNGGFPGRKLYITLAEGGEPVGTVRSDEDETDGYVEISYTVAPAARGKGFGKAMVLQFAKEELAGKKIKAEIKKGGNGPSEGIARALGLHPTDERPSEDPDDPRPLVMWH